MSIAKRGFGSMSPERRREISSMGGRAAQARGTGHQWDAASAKEAGRKGGRASQAARRQEEDVPLPFAEPKVAQ